MGLKDFIPTAPEKFFTKGEDGKLHEDDNIVNGLVDFYSDDFNKILGELASRNMKPGKFIAGGKVGVVFELETLDGKKIESAALRFDPEGSINALDSSMAVDPLLKLKNDFFETTVVPRGDPTRDPTKEEIKTSLEIYNAEGAERYLQDMKPDQFMKFPGIDGAVLIDMGSVRTEPLAEGESPSQGGVKELAERLSINFDELMATKASPELLIARRAQKEALSASVRQEMLEKGINMENVPPIQKINTLQPVAGRNQSAALG